MRKIHLPLIALCLVGVTAAWAVSGIEVLHYDPAGEGYLCTTQSFDYPPGAYVEAVMVVDGIEVLFDMAPVDPMTGISTVHFAEHHPSNFVRLCGPCGIELARQPINQDPLGMLEYEEY